MSTRTVAHYIELACRKSGGGLSHESVAELQDALDGMVEEAVRKAVAAVTPPRSKPLRKGIENAQ